MALNRIKNPESINVSSPLASTAGANFTGVSALSVVLENGTIVTTAPPAQVNFNLLDNGSLIYYTANATANWMLSIRGNSITPISSLLRPGQSVTASILVTNGAVPYSMSNLYIDGQLTTPRWQMGASPQGGNANSIDIYTLTIIKLTDAPTFTVLGSFTRFA